MLLRSTNGLTPTEAGRNFYDRAKRSIEEGEAAELAARGTAAALSGRLRICAPLTFTCLHVMPRLPVFLAELSGGQAGECQGPRICQLPGPSLAADPTAGRQPDRRQGCQWRVAVSSRRSITSTTRLCADRSRSAQSMMRTTYEAFDVREPSLEAGEA